MGPAAPSAETVLFCSSAFQKGGQLLVFDPSPAYSSPKYQPGSSLAGGDAGVGLRAWKQAGGDRVSPSLPPRLLPPYGLEGDLHSYRVMHNHAPLTAT